MPDILIRGIGLPKGETAELNIRIKPDGTILNHVGIHLRERAVELPLHGDLIDMDKIQYTELYGGVEVTTANWIDSLPVIVPAERRDGP